MVPIHAQGLYKITPDRHFLCWREAGADTPAAPITITSSNSVLSVACIHHTVHLRQGSSVAAMYQCGTHPTKNCSTFAPIHDSFSSRSAGHEQIRPRSQLSSQDCKACIPFGNPLRAVAMTHHDFQERSSRAHPTRALRNLLEDLHLGNWACPSQGRMNFGNSPGRFHSMTTYTVLGLVDLPPTLVLLLHTPNYDPSTKVMNASGSSREECGAIEDPFAAVPAEFSTVVKSHQRS
ncbi:hypothetical protein P171DRAFT_239937 [Karstenula rhodostoma CBS 690.94]|uniref:Uncharacterized protein n=1 Tax=Karstenula rhodostoma CBS 690.94 TaxID=1392251 RepID=A0A9P4PMP9_9PLEO|nr:hypothetical protein P171DRAFT_239937 [Karstenula rhodostoma CBS 690.94]